VDADNPDSGKAQRERLYEAQSLKYQDGAHAALEAFDKAILTLSAGALGLSLGFIKDVAPLSTAVGLWLLYWSWGFLGAAIFLTLFSFIASYQAFEQQKEVAFEYYINQTEHVRTQGRWALITRYVTYVAGGFFVAALLLTLIFAIRNVRHASAIIKTNQEVSVRDKNGPITPNPNQEQKGVEPSRPIRVPEPNRLVVPNNTPVKSPSQNQNNGK